MMRTLMVGLVFFAGLAPAIAQLQTVVKPSLPDLGGNDSSADISPMVCRPPQAQSDSRLPGPKVCRTQRQWDDLHNQGLDIGADGKSIVASEKYRSLHGEGCGASASCGH